MIVISDFWQIPWFFGFIRPSKQIKKTLFTVISDHDLIGFVLFRMDNLLVLSWLRKGWCICVLTGIKKEKKVILFNATILFSFQGSPRGGEAPRAPRTFRHKQTNRQILKSKDCSIWQGEKWKVYRSISGHVVLRMIQFMKQFKREASIFTKNILFFIFRG